MFLNCGTAWVHTGIYLNTYIYQIVEQPVWRNHRQIRNYGSTLHPYYTLPNAMCILNRPDKLYVLLVYFCFFVSSLQTSYRWSYFLGPPTVNLHCLDVEEKVRSYLECGMIATQELVYNYAFVYQSGCRVCRSRSGGNAHVNSAEYLLVGPHYVRGESFRFGEEWHFCSTVISTVKVLASPSGGTIKWWYHGKNIFPVLFACYEGTPPEVATVLIGRDIAHIIRDKV